MGANGLVVPEIVYFQHQNNKHSSFDAFVK